MLIRNFKDTCCHGQNKRDEFALELQRTTKSCQI